MDRCDRDGGGERAMASVAEALRMAAVPAAEVEDDSGPRERRRKLRDLGPWPLPRPVKGFGDCIIRPDDVPARRQIHDTRIAAPPQTPPAPAAGGAGGEASSSPPLTKIFASLRPRRSSSHRTSCTIAGKFPRRGGGGGGRPAAGALVR